MQGVSDAMLGVSRRERMARRADKWWRSVWHVQMCMGAKGLDVEPDFAKPLTDVFRVGRVKTQTTKTKPTDMSDGPTDGEQT